MYRFSDVWYPVSDISESKTYAILRGSKDTLYTPSVSNSASTSSIQYSLPIPSPQTIIDRRMYQQWFVQLDFDQDLQLGTNDAFRQFPISSVCTNIQANINNQGVSVDLSDIVHPLMKYRNAWSDELSKTLTTTPSMPDAYQNYSDWNLYGDGRNPLSDFGVASPIEPRGGFPITVVTARQIRAVITEPLLLLPPFISGNLDMESAGLCGISSLTINVTMSNGLSRMWSSCNTNSLSTVTVSFYQNPQLLFRAIAPLETQVIPKAISYPYSEYARYTTSVGSVAANATTTVNTNNIQLSNMPNSIYLYARRSNATSTFLTSDSFALIQSLSVTLGTSNGKLASATTQDLFQICVNNGFNQGWSSWSFYNGSVLKLKPAFDLPIDSTTAPGSLGTYNLQFTNVVIQNQNQSSSVNFDLFVVTESEGVLSVVNGVVSKIVGPITAKDVLASHQKSMGYAATKHALGGNFLSDLWSGVKEVGKQVGKVALPVASQLALPLAKKALGLGKKKKGRRGGAAISSQELQAKLLKAQKNTKDLESDGEEDDQ